MDLFCLRYAVAHTSGAEHLEGMKKADTPAKKFERKWFGCVEPLADMPLGCHHRFSLLWVLCGRVGQLPVSAVMLSVASSRMKIPLD